MLTFEELETRIKEMERDGHDIINLLYLYTEARVTEIHVLNTDILTHDMVKIQKYKNSLRKDIDKEIERMSLRKIKEYFGDLLGENTDSLERLVTTNKKEENLKCISDPSSTRTKNFFKETIYTIKLVTASINGIRLHIPKDIAEKHGFVKNTPLEIMDEDNKYGYRTRLSFNSSKRSSKGSYIVYIRAILRNGLNLQAEDFVQVAIKGNVLVIKKKI